MTLTARGGGGSTRANAHAKLGTFAGVFTPSILTILGIVLFMRLGFVVGAAGLGRALVIILLANSISVLTSVSLAAVATNLRTKGGGDYYLISRTLGVAFGGALGLVLFLAQSVSIAFYAIGFGEACAAIAGGAAAWLPSALAAGAVLALFVFAWLGTDWASRLQFAVMALMFGGIASFLVGGFASSEGAFLAGNWEAPSELPFWAIFAIFFPAVTGFTQGVSMSGDLKEPGRSLPTGTFLAVGVSLVVYLVVAVVLAASSSNAELVSDYASMRRIAAWGWLVDAGVLSATLSSGLASFLGAPRILQSLAADKVFPFLDFFAVGSGASHNPRRGVLLACGIALGTIALGDLNLVAPVVSMFFLISYGLLNYATYYEASANSPFFRPRFRWFHPKLSLLGALACLGTMLAVNPLAGIAALVILFGIFQYVRRRAPTERWADSSRSHRLRVVRDNVYALSDELEHARDWRPVLLAFSDDPLRRERIVRLASWLEGESGFTTVVRLIEGEGAEVRQRKVEGERELRADLAARGLRAFPLVVTGSPISACISTLLQAHGLGAIRPNTVVLNWFDGETAVSDGPGLQAYGRHLRLALRNGCNVVILEATTDELETLAATPVAERRIDVWFRHDATARLSLLFAYLMTRSEDWHGASIRVLADASAAEEALRDDLLATLGAMLSDIRIDAEPVIVADMEVETLVRESADASIVFLPFRLHGDRPTGPSGKPLEDSIDRLPLTVFVLAARDIDLDAEPESGGHALLAEAFDRAEKARKVARAAQKDADRAAAALAEARKKRDLARAAAPPPDALADLEELAARAEVEAERARRRAAKGSAKAELAKLEAEELQGNAGAPAAEAAAGEPASE